MRIMTRLFLLLFSTAIAGSAMADGFPNKPVRFIVPYPPGGTTDILARTIGQKLEQRWGQSVVIENRPGGNSIIATGAVANARPDGYTIGMVLTPHVVNPNVNPDLPYDTAKDFTPITMVAKFPGLMVASKASGAKNIDDVIRLAKENPGKLNYGSAGPLTSSQLSMEILKYQTGIDITHIPYKGGAPALMAVLANEVQFVIGGPPNLMPNVLEGNLQTIGVTTKNRAESLPEVPTIAEQGLADFDTYEWYGVVAPAGLPKEVVTELNEAIVEVLKMPDVQESFKKRAAEIVGNSSEEFGKFIDDELRFWKELVNNISFETD